MMKITCELSNQGNYSDCCQDKSHNNLLHNIENNQNDWVCNLNMPIDVESNQDSRSDLVSEKGPVNNPKHPCTYPCGLKIATKYVHAEKPCSDTWNWHVKMDLTQRAKWVLKSTEKS